MPLILLYVFTYIICFPHFFFFYLFLLAYVAIYSTFSPWLISKLLSDFPFNLWLHPLSSFHIDTYYFTITWNWDSMSFSKNLYFLWFHTSPQKWSCWDNFTFPIFLPLYPTQVLEHYFVLSLCVPRFLRFH